MSNDVLEKKIKQLSTEEQEQVIKFIDEIVNHKNDSFSKYKPTFNWAGGLEELKDKYTSVQLQKKATEWWTEKP